MLDIRKSRNRSAIPEFHLEERKPSIIVIISLVREYMLHYWHRFNIACGYAFVTSIDILFGYFCLFINIELVLNASV